MPTGLLLLSARTQRALLEIIQGLESLQAKTLPLRVICCPRGGRAVVVGVNVGLSPLIHLKVNLQPSDLE